MTVALQLLVVDISPSSQVLAESKVKESGEKEHTIYKTSLELNEKMNKETNYYASGRLQRHWRMTDNSQICLLACFHSRPLFSVFPLSFFFFIFLPSMYFGWLGQCKAVNPSVSRCCVYFGGKDSSKRFLKPRELRYYCS